MLKKILISITCALALTSVSFSASAAPSEADLEALSKDHWTLYIVAQQRFADADIDGAILLLNRAIKYSTNEGFSELARTTLLGMYKTSGNIRVMTLPKKAIETFNLAIQLNPNDHYSFRRMGDAYCRLKQFQACLKSHNRALELRPDKAEGYWLRGMAFVSYFDDKQSAQADFERSVALFREAGEIEKAEKKTKIYKGFLSFM